MDGARQSYLESGQSFVTETVCSDPHGAKLNFLREALDRGYEVHLIYIGLDSPETSDARVVTRLMAGGHDVPADRIPRRYAQSLQSLKAALKFVPNVTVGVQGTLGSGTVFQIIFPVRYARLSAKAPVCEKAADYVGSGLVLVVDDQPNTGSSLAIPNGASWSSPRTMDASNPISPCWADEIRPAKRLLPMEEIMSHRNTSFSSSWEYTPGRWNWQTRQT